MSIRTKLILMFVFFSAVPLLICGYLMEKRSHQPLMEQIGIEPIAIMIGLIFLFVLLLALIFSRWLTAPLLSIASAAEDIGQGKPIELPTSRSRDEMGFLTRTFSRMARELEIYQRELLRSKDYTDGIIASLMDPLLVVSDTGEIEKINRPTLELLGRELKEIKGQSIEIFFPGIHKDLLLKKEEDLHNREVLVKTAQGDLIPCLLNRSNMERGKVFKFVFSLKDISERKKREEILRYIALELSSKTGRDLFEKIAQYLATELNLDIVLLGKLTAPDRIKTLTCWEENRLRENFEYTLEGSPCGRVVKDRYCSFPRDVYKNFPDNFLLAPKKIEGYLGIPLINSAGEPLGTLVAMSKAPIENPERLLSFLRMFSLRTSAEIERMEMEEALQKSEKQLRILVESAPDGIFVEQDNRLVYINPAGLALKAHVVKEEEDWNHEEEDIATEEEEKVQLLIFRLKDGGRGVIPLSKTARLERIPLSSVERSGNYDVIQYRGGILPLIYVNPLLSGSPTPSLESLPDPLQVAIYWGEKQNVGLVVEQILDIVEAKRDIHPCVNREGILGTLVIQGKVADFLDIPTLIKKSNPPVFENLTVLDGWEKN